MEEENLKDHAVGFVQYIKDNGYGADLMDAEVDLDALYADYLFDIEHHDK